MSSPITTRLSDPVLAAVDRAVTAGMAETRAALIAAAVDEWLARHGEDAVAESYRRRYGGTGVDQGDDDTTLARLAAFSVAACLADQR